jgi:hypothetical protein
MNIFQAESLISKKNSLFYLWLIVLLYGVISSIFIQFVVLPYIFPSFHAGDGLLKGGDWVSFQELAVELSQRIRTEGWSVWELRPGGQAPAGIAAAIYALTVPKPWTLIPLNAALHATAAIILLLIILQCIDNRRIALLCTLPFVFFPSAMTWYTQIHKDGYFILGALLFIYGWIVFLGIMQEKAGWSGALKGILLMYAGIFFVWIVRPYGVQMLQGLDLCVTVVMSTVFIVHFAKKRLRFKKMIISLLLCWMVLITITPFTKGGIIYEIPSDAISNRPSDAISNRPSDAYSWIKSGWVPDYIENKIYSLSLVREGFRKGYPEAGSNIDTNISYHSIGDVVRYIPRALEIVLLAPFPRDWFGEGTSDWNSIMRRISGFEMIVVYFSLFFVPFFILGYRRSIKLWLVIFFSVGMMLIYGLTIPNVGSLYRVRYGFIMLFVAFGWAGLAIFLQKVHSKSADAKNVELLRR